MLFLPIALLGNAIGSVLRYPDIGTAILFPPYAALTAILVVSSRRHWLWYIVAGAVAHFVTHWPHWSVSWVLLADVANVARAVTAAALLRRLFNGPPRLDSLSTLARFIVAAAILAPAIGATLGAANVVLHGASPTYWQPWRAWFLSNALTGLTILPAFVLAIGECARWHWPLTSPRRTLEAIATSVAVLGTAALAFVVPPVGTWHVALHFYAPLPAIIWAALRFGPGGASAALTATTFTAILGADRSTGPFQALALDEDVLALQLFVFLTTIPVLCIAAISTSRQNIVHLHRALLASVHDHIAILDGSGVVVEVNDGWRRFAQRSDVDLASFRRARVGDDYVEKCRAAAESGDAFAGSVFAGVTGVLERREPRFDIEFDDDRNGRHERYALTIEPLARLAGGAIVRRYDVTARHQAQTESEEQRRQLSHLARVAVLGQLSGALAHELNQPLAAIASNADAARRLLSQHPTNYAELEAILTDIIASNHRAAQVIRRLRAMLKRGETRLQPIDTAELVNEVLELGHAELITRRVTATTMVGPDLPPVLGDRVQLQQVFLNLLLNACEAMASTPPPDRRLSLIVTADARRNVQFSVRDSGTGIPESLIDRLFEPFVTTKPEGLGLGLSISRTIVAAHGGRLWAQNNADRGATVHCLLPSTLVQQAPSAPFGNRPAQHPALSHV